MDAIDIILASRKLHESDTDVNPKTASCNFKSCMAGMGVAGMEKCFLKGNGLASCDKYINEDKYIESMEVI